MAKMDLLAEGRTQGMGFAARIAREAQEKGLDPVRAIDNELRNRKLRNVYALRTEKELQHDTKEAVYLAYKIALVISMATLWGEFKWGGIKRLPRFVDAYIRYIIAIGKGEEGGGTSLDDIVALLDREVGVIVNLDSKELAVDFRRSTQKKDKMY